MAALRSGCGHYIFAPWVLLSFFPRLISAVTDWMSTILAHMVWPSCEFRMQVWNVLHTPHWNTGRKNCHLGTIAQLCRAVSSQLRHVSTIGKKIFNSNTSSTCPDGEVRPTSGWDRFGSLGHPSKFQRVSHLAFVTGLTAATSLTTDQPNFARCLAVSLAATLYVHFRGLLPPDGILPSAKFTYLLYVQVLRSPTLAALLHGTPAAGVSQTLQHGTRNGIT